MTLVSYVSLVSCNSLVSGLGDGWGTLPPPPSPIELTIKELGSHLLQVSLRLSDQSKICQNEIAFYLKIVKVNRVNAYQFLHYIGIK